jgi:hypothetical protein
LPLTPDQVGNRAWKNLGKYAKGQYADQYVERGYRDRDDAPLNPKDLRAAYAAAAWHLFAPRRVSINPYYARILGHSEDDVLTSFSYDVFYVWGEAKEHAEAWFKEYARDRGLDSFEGIVFGEDSRQGAFDL